MARLSILCNVRQHLCLFQIEQAEYDITKRKGKVGMVIYS